MTEHVEELIKGVIRNPASRDFLHFLARHPYARFNGQALIQLLSPDKTNVAEEVLERLVATGLVEMQMHEGVTIFRLTRNEPAHGLLMATFDNIKLTQQTIKPVERLSIPLAPSAP